MRLRLRTGIILGVTMKALTPAIVVGCTVTPRAARISGSVATTAAAALSTIAFHSAGFFGTTFQVGLYGCPMIACICGLTVSGTGMTRAGTCRAPGGTVEFARGCDGWAAHGVTARSNASTVAYMVFMNR